MENPQDSDHLVQPVHHADNNRRAVQVLGDSAENAFRQSLLGSGGSLAIFVSNPMVGSLTAMALLMLCWPILGAIKGYFGRPTGDSDPNGKTG